jgi:hypothetical protein
MSDRASAEPSAVTAPAGAGAAPDRPRIGPVAILLVLLMAIGSIVMWLVAPIGLIWLAAHTGSAASPTLGPLLIVALALPVTTVVIAIMLRKLDHWFSDITGMTHDNRRLAVPWMRGMTEHRGVRRKATILDVVMVISVVGAGTVAAILWLFAKPF